MKSTSTVSNIPLKEIEEHYRLSRENYDVESGESHLAYYREKHPIYYRLLLNSLKKET